MPLFTDTLHKNWIIRELWLTPSDWPPSRNLSSNFRFWILGNSWRRFILSRQNRFEKQRRWMDGLPHQPKTRLHWCKPDNRNSGGCRDVWSMYVEQSLDREIDPADDIPSTSRQCTTISRLPMVTKPYTWVVLATCFLLNFSPNNKLSRWQNLTRLTCPVTSTAKNPWKVWSH